MPFAAWKALATKWPSIEARRWSMILGLALMAAMGQQTIAAVREWASNANLFPSELVQVNDRKLWTAIEWLALWCGMVVPRLRPGSGRERVLP